MTANVILEKSKWLDLIIPENATEYKPYIMLRAFYDPLNNYQPVGGLKRKPLDSIYNGFYAKEAHELLERGKMKFDLLNASKTKQAELF